MSKKLKKLESRFGNEYDLEMQAWGALYDAMCDAGLNDEWVCDALRHFELCVIDTNETSRKIIKLGGIIDES
jgi:hypothetical protein